MVDRRLLVTLLVAATIFWAVVAVLGILLGLLSGATL
jgi:hypothetical protein